MFQRLSVELLVLVTIITSIVSASIQPIKPIQHLQEDDDTSSNSNSWFGPELTIVQKVYDDCQSNNDFTGCLKGRALTALSKAIDQVICTSDRVTQSILLTSILIIG